MLFHPSAWHAAQSSHKSFKHIRSTLHWVNANVWGTAFIQPGSLSAIQMYSLRQASAARALKHTVEVPSEILQKSQVSLSLRLCFSLPSDPSVGRGSLCTILNVSSSSLSHLHVSKAMSLCQAATSTSFSASLSWLVLTWWLTTCW